MFFIIFFIVLCIQINIISSETFQVILEPRWDILDRPSTANTCTDAMVFIAKITFKKKIADQTSLSSMIFKWHGSILQHLSGSLYRREPGKKFIPIEKNVICDSQWDKEQQTLSFIFPKPERLNINSEFYLVIIVPKDLTATLKIGTFTILEKSLPNIMQQSSKNDTLTIAFSDIDYKKIISLH